MISHDLEAMALKEIDGELEDVLSEKKYFIALRKDN